MSLVPLAVSPMKKSSKRKKQTLSTTTTSSCSLSSLNSSASSVVSVSSSSSSDSLERAKELAVEAVRLDSEGHYERAAAAYRQAIVLFREFGRREVTPALEKHPKVRSGLKEKIRLCSERLRVLETSLLQKKKKDLSPLFRDVVEEVEEEEELPENDYELISPLQANTSSSSMMKSSRSLAESALSISGSTHSLYPRCEIKRTTSIISGASDFGLGEEIYDHPSTTKAMKTPPLANMDAELRLSQSSLSSDEGITTTMRRKKKTVSPETDADAILVLDEEEDDDEVQLLEDSFEVEKDQEETYVRADRCTSNRFGGGGDNVSDSGISEERTVISSTDSSCGRSSSSRNKSPDSVIKERLYSSSFSGSAYELYSEEILSAETHQPPRRDRYEYVPPRAFARHKKEKELDGCFYLMACLDAFGVL